MVPQEFSKESLANVSHQGALSDLYACPSHHVGRCCCSQRGEMNHYDLLSKNFSSNFQLLGTQIDNSIEPFCMSRYKQYGFCGFDHVHGHGLSLSLGNDLDLNNVRLYDNKETSTPTVFGGVMSEPSCSCAEHMRESCLTRKDDVLSCSHASRCSYSKLHDVSLLIDILQNSPYLEPAWQLLDEVVCVSDYFKLSLSGKSDAFNHSKESSQTDHLPMEKQLGDIGLTKLTALRDELEVLCRRYFLQMDELVIAFEAVAGAGAAAAYTALTIQAMSKHFSHLRHAIIAKIDSSKESHLIVNSKNDKPKRVALQRLGMNQVKQIWRPLRGLPEESVLVLRGWLFEHFLHPYPSDKEKLLLASQTGLTRNQISNWFINARVRLWKPMIEEMYREEIAEEQQN